MEKQLERYNKDKDVLQSIIQEKNIYQTQNIATQAKYGETLIVRNNQLVALTNDLIVMTGNMDLELEEKTIENDNLKKENTYLKNTLNKKDIDKKISI